jgi:DNA replication licensing factor MCM5
VQERPEDVPTGELPRSLTATCDRGLVGTVSPGTRVTIVGVYAINTGTDNNKKKGDVVAIRQPYIR